MKRDLCCPDLGIVAPEDLYRVGRGVDGRSEGVAFPACPVWWMREPTQFPGRSPSAGVRTPFAAACEARRWMDSGALAPAPELPGRLHAMLLALSSQEAIRAESERRDAEIKARLREAAGNDG